MCVHDSAAGNGQPSKLQQYEMAYAQIARENEWIGHRITWFLTFQGFLFTAVFFAVGIFVGKDYELRDEAARYLAIAIGALIGLGIASCYVCFRLIQAANRHIDDVADWWNGHVEAPQPFPPIRGDGYRGQDWKRKDEAPAPSKRLGAAGSALVIAIVWALFAVLLWLGSSLPPRAAEPEARGLTAADKEFLGALFNKWAKKNEAR